MKLELEMGGRDGLQGFTVEVSEPMRTQRTLCRTIAASFILSTISIIGFASSFRLGVSQGMRHSHWVVLRAPPLECSSARAAFNSSA